MIKALKLKCEVMYLQRLKFGPRFQAGFKHTSDITELWWKLYTKCSSVVLVGGMSVLVRQEGREDRPLERNFKDSPNV